MRPSPPPPPVESGLSQAKTALEMDQKEYQKGVKSCLSRSKTPLQERQKESQILGPRSCVLGPRSWVLGLGSFFPEMQVVQKATILSTDLAVSSHFCPKVRGGHFGDQKLEKYDLPPRAKTPFPDLKHP